MRRAHARENEHNNASSYYHFEIIDGEDSPFLRPIIMVIVEIKNGLYDIMYRPVLESVKKEAKISLATRNESKMGFHFRSEYVGSGEVENQLMRAARTEHRSPRSMPLTKDTRSDRLSLSVMPAQPDIAGMLAKSNEES